MSVIGGFQVTGYTTGAGAGGWWEPPSASSAYPHRYLNLLAGATVGLSLGFLPDSVSLPSPTRAGWPLRLSDYPDLYGIVQTEKPLFVELAWGNGPNAPLIGFFLTTQEEPLGEGPAETRARGIFPLT